MLHPHALEALVFMSNMYTALTHARCLEDTCETRLPHVWSLTWVWARWSRTNYARNTFSTCTCNGLSENVLSHDLKHSLYLVQVGFILLHFLKSLKYRFSISNCGHNAHSLLSFSFLSFSTSYLNHDLPQTRMTWASLSSNVFPYTLVYLSELSGRHI